MRKSISFILVLALILTSFTFVFGADSHAPADVKGTKYEKAVMDLIKKEVITGYPDGSFKPADSINRAQACVVIVNSMKPSKDKLKEAGKSSFKDLADYGWAAEYINYAESKGIISGYSGGVFKPGGKVTYAEMASMLVRALGYKTSELSGSWPDNFILKAKELGVFKGLEFDANTSAIRGDVALMTAVVADDIEKNNAPDKEPEDGKDEPEKDSDNPLADFSGRAYGILLDVARVLNAKGDIVDEYEFLIGKKVLFIKTDGRVTSDDTTKINERLDAGDLYGLQMNDGVVKKFDTSDKNFTDINSKDFENFGITDWQPVKSAKNRVIEMSDEFAGDRKVFTVLEDASIYLAEEKNGEITGYKPGTINDVRADSKVRLYSVTGETPGVVEIVLVKK